MSINEFIQSLTKNKKSSELNTLFKKPIPENKLQMPVSQVFEPNVYYQADLLYMPNDEGFKYILGCVDLYDGALDAEPLKERNNKTIIEAFKRIFKRKYLTFPVFITLDQGTEFKGETEDYFNSNGVYVKYALTGRHRQLANIERVNQKIQSILFKRMASQELLTGEPSKEWVLDLSELVEIFNKKKKKPLKQAISDIPVADEYSGNLLKIGQKVRILLDYPINNTNHKRLNGNFRTSDTRWTNKIYKIKEVLLKPSYPPMYLTDNNDDVARTKNQLQPVSNKLIEPDARFIRGEPEFYLVSKILDKRIVNRKTEYKIKWRGFSEDQATWISSKELERTNDLKEMKRKFNEEN
jgi:hypothetical protein